MSRSGKALVLLAAASALAGCTAVVSEPRETVDPPPASEPVAERSCPEGFTDALAAHVSATTGRAVEVVEDADYAFRPTRLNDALAAGCVVRVEQAIPDGVMIQVFGAGAEHTYHGGSRAPVSCRRAREYAASCN